MVTAKKSEQSRNVATDKGLEQFLPASVQKSYFMLSDAERKVLNTALEKYRPGQSEPILVGGREVLKPALRLMRNYRLVIEEIKDSQAITSYTRWVDAVQVREAEVYLIFSPRFEHIWIESKKSLLDFAGRKPAHIGLRSRYAIRLYAWAKERIRQSNYTAERMRRGGPETRSHEVNVHCDISILGFVYTVYGAIINTRRTRHYIFAKCVPLAHFVRPTCFMYVAKSQ